MIEIKNLKVSYGNNCVLDNLNLVIRLNTIHGLVGLNGSGKTTLLNTVFGLKKQQQGKVEYNSEKIRRNQIAFLETINYFYPGITGKEYLSLFQIQNPAFDIEKWNELFELPLNDLTDNYSTGMKKKLAFLGVICLDREILILDEPFNGVDLETVQKMKSLLVKLKKTKTVIITSHILESLLGICNSISYLNGRKIQFTKEKKDFEKLESEIFSLHQQKIDDKIKGLIG